MYILDCFTALAMTKKQRTAGPWRDLFDKQEKTHYSQLNNIVFLKQYILKKHHPKDRCSSLKGQCLFVF